MADPGARYRGADAGRRGRSASPGVVHVDKSSPERKRILDVIRGSVQRRLGIKVTFVVDRLAVYGDFAYAQLKPRTEAGGRIDYRRTRYAENFDPEQDSDTVCVLLQRADSRWSIVEEAFLPTDVVWETWMKDHELPRALFFEE